MFNNIKLGTKTMLLFAVGLILSFAAMFIINQIVFEKTAIEALVVKARAITIEAENARQYVENLRSQYNTFDDEKLFKEFEDKLKGREFESVEERLKAIRTTDAYWTIPIVAGWTVGQTNADKANFQFRVPKIQPRNPKNEPDPFERAILEKLRKGNLEEFHQIDEATNTLRYFRPVKLSKGCLICHGTIADDPDNDGLDPLGFEMEGWAEGEVHGAFEVFADLTPIQEQTQDNLITTFVAAVIIILVALLCTFLFIHYNLTQPLRKTMGMLELLSQGDLTQRLNLNRKDEVGQMGESMDQFADAFSGTIQHIDLSAQQVSDGAENLSHSSITLSQGASQQASSLEQISASLTEISSQTEQNSKNASEANNLAVEARKNADRGDQQMKELTQAITEIDTSSQQISKIIKVIDEIAFQTNLLALNAAVEAARAGVHGKGFAVVANEVRNLAVRSADAAKETTQMIEESLGKVKQGIQISHKTAEALLKIVKSVEKVSMLAEEIDASSREQASGFGQISQGMTQLEVVTQQNSVISEKNASASQQLTNLAQELRDQTAKFKLINDSELSSTSVEQIPQLPKLQRLE